jgi:hypothetical protein
MVYLDAGTHLKTPNELNKDLSRFSNRAQNFEINFFQKEKIEILSENNFSNNNNSSDIL